ncbi:hypothetical protein RvY_03803 [Ramazzottius varieornatus]|uniref:Uncharacterized protein n=1 Tax=Ramazzottius varieornatus TaxID=947166 RepID=A0A1D1USZ5_RAMVA|nr:hypothetical protein RvY_03803 [Ramazzottius varieornatus]
MASTYHWGDLVRSRRFTSFRPSSDSSVSGTTADAIRFSERTRVPMNTGKQCRAQQPSDLKSDLAVPQVSRLIRCVSRIRVSVSNICCSTFSCLTANFWLFTGTLDSQLERNTSFSIRLPFPCSFL